MFPARYGVPAFQYGTHATYDVTPEGVAVIKFDSPGVKVNSLNGEVMAEMKEIFGEVQSRENIKAAVLISGKPDCFIAGADIKMLEK